MFSQSYYLKAISKAVLVHKLYVKMLNCHFNEKSTKQDKVGINLRIPITSTDPTHQNFI